jgi:hypothetical protein
MKPRRRRSLFAAVSLALVTTATGCADIGLAPRVPVVQDWTSLPTAPAEVVSAAHQDLKSTLGVQVVWQSDTSPEQTAIEANRIFNYVVALGANAVGINFYFDTNGSRPNRVYAEQGVTPSPYTIGLVVANAQAHGLRVLLRPLLSENNLGTATGNWRGNIKPTSVPAWFTSYYKFLRPYLSVAQQDHADGFAIGTELDSLALATKQWKSMETKIGYVYSGPLTFAVNWDDWPRNGKPEPVPHVAVDAYPNTKLGVNASVQQLTAAWTKWLDTQPEQTLKQTVLQEVGIAPAEGAYIKPASYGAAMPQVSAAIQRNWFAAACKAARSKHVGGVFYYVVYDTDQPGAPASLLDATRTLSFTSVSDSVIKTCFNSGWS